MSDLPTRQPPQQPGAPGPGGAPSPGGGGGSTEEVLRSKKSIFNPADMAMAKEEGVLEMPIREFFAMNGVDVDGPMSQMVKFVAEQAKNADPLNKMQAIARSQPPQDPLEAGQAPPPQGGKPAPGGGGDPLERLMSQ